MTLDERNIHSLAAPYALDALDDLERRRFEEHLASGCATCAEEVAGFSRVATALATAEEAPVSDELRRAVLDAPDTVRQVGPRLGGPRLRRVARRAAAVAAAVLAIATAGLTTVVLDQQDRIASLEQDAAVAAILQRPDAEVTTVEAGDGVVRVVASAATGEGAVVVTGLERLPPERTYQLWLIDGDGATSGGLLEVAPDGAGERVLAGSVADAAAVGISVEPAGGSAAPTTTPIAVVELGTTEARG